MYECINIQKAKSLITEENALLVDIRDTEDYAVDFDPITFHLTNETLPDFMASTPKSRPLIVMCYHGISSKQLAYYLVSEGFEKIYSLDGGYEKWKIDTVK